MDINYILLKPGSKLPKGCGDGVCPVVYWRWDNDNCAAIEGHYEGEEGWSSEQVHPDCPLRIVCPECEGYGAASGFSRDENVKCPTCNGKGVVRPNRKGTNEL